jgi:hypothetical protein
VVRLLEAARPADPRPRRAIEHARAWVRGEVTMMQARAAGGHPMGAARDLRGAPRNAAYAAGQAACVAHVAAHELGAAALGSEPHAPARRTGRANASGDASVTSRSRGRTGVEETRVPWHDRADDPIR